MCHSHFRRLSFTTGASSPINCPRRQNTQRYMPDFPANKIESSTRIIQYQLRIIFRSDRYTLPIESIPNASVSNNNSPPPSPR